MALTAESLAGSGGADFPSGLAVGEGDAEDVFKSPEGVGGVSARGGGEVAAADIWAAAVAAR